MDYSRNEECKCLPVSKKFMFQNTKGGIRMHGNVNQSSIEQDKCYSVSLLKIQLSIKLVTELMLEQIALLSYLQWNASRNCFNIKLYLRS